VVGARHQGSIHEKMASRCLHPHTSLIGIGLSLGPLSTLCLFHSSSPWDPFPLWDDYSTYLRILWFSTLRALISSSLLRLSSYTCRCISSCISHFISAIIVLWFAIVLVDTISLKNYSAPRWTPKCFLYGTELPQEFSLLYLCSSEFTSKVFQGSLL